MGRVSNIGSQQCNNELTFALTYEVNFGIDFEVDSEFRPIGCNGDMEKMQWGGKGRGTTVNCPPNLKEYEGKPLSTITRGIAEDHDVWNQAFLSGWEKMAMRKVSFSLVQKIHGLVAQTQNLLKMPLIL